MEAQSTLSKLKCFSFISSQDETKFKELKRLEEAEILETENLKIRLSLALVLSDLDKRKVPLANLSSKIVYVQGSQCFIKQSDFTKNINQDQNEQSRLFLEKFKTILKENFQTTKYEKSMSFQEIIRITDGRQEKMEELMSFLNTNYGITQPNLIYHHNNNIAVYKHKKDSISPQLLNYLPQGYKPEDIIIKVRNITDNHQLESQCYEQLNDCENVCKLFCYIRTNQFEILFLEYYPMTLDKYFIQYKPELFDQDLLRQIILAVKFMHDRNILHRDIKFQNILVSTNGNIPQIKFIDFDVSQRDDTELLSFSSVNKTNRPPNSFEKQFKYEKEDDIWQLTKMVLEYQIQRLLTSNFNNIPPIEFQQDGINYQKNNLFEYTQKMKEIKNEKYRQLIYEGLQFCKDARPTIKELIELIP